MSDVGVDKPVRQEAPPPKTHGSLRWLNTVRDAFLQRREASVLLVALGLVVYFRAASDVFLTHDNLVNIAQAAAPSAMALARAAGDTSTATTWAPSATPIITADRPTPPHPCTASQSPASSRP